MPKNPHHINRNREYDALRREQNPWRALYNTKRWQVLRLRVFQRDGYICQMCGKLASSPVANHKKRHMGDPALFFDEAKVETMHESCHNIDQQRIERGGVAREQTGEDGWPTPRGDG